MLHRTNTAAPPPEGPRDPQGITLRTLSMASRTLAALLMLGERGGLIKLAWVWKGASKQVAPIFEMLSTPAGMSERHLGPCLPSLHSDVLPADVHPSGSWIIFPSGSYSGPDYGTLLMLMAVCKTDVLIVA